MRALPVLFILIPAKRIRIHMKKLYCTCTKLNSSSCSSCWIYKKNSECSRLNVQNVWFGCLVECFRPFLELLPVLNSLLLHVPAELLTHSLASFNSNSRLTFVDCKCHWRATAAVANTTSTLPAIVVLSRWSGAIIFPSCCGYRSVSPSSVGLQHVKMD